MPCSMPAYLFNRAMLRRILSLDALILDHLENTLGIELSHSTPHPESE